MAHMSKHTLLVALLAAGCSSGSSGDGGIADSGSTVDSRVPAGDAGAQGLMTWKYDGVMHSANTITAIHMKTAVIDTLDIVAGQSTGDGVGINIADLDPNDSITITGTYHCPGTNVIELLFVYNVTGSNSPMSCTVTVIQPGMAGAEHAVGTFEAVLSNGKAITEGMFDTPIGTVIHL
jgi:hypothetical protein